MSRAHTPRYVPTRTTRLRRSCRRIPLGRSHFRCRRRSASGDIPSGYATRSCALPDSENAFRQMQRYLGNALLVEQKIAKNTKMTGINALFFAVFASFCNKRFIKSTIFFCFLSNLPMRAMPATQVFVGGALCAATDWSCRSRRIAPLPHRYGKIIHKKTSIFFGKVIYYSPRM